ncbi:hypothetical protein GW846_03915 [Candidatus Gracilibacteria bacterium]|nr:hypothetical protein [Candidatus Gracilibacteria bacterium]
MSETTKKAPLNLKAMSKDKKEKKIIDEDAVKAGNIAVGDTAVQESASELKKEVNPILTPGDDEGKDGTPTPEDKPLIKKISLKAIKKVEPDTREITENIDTESLSTPEIDVEPIESEKKGDKVAISLDGEEVKLQKDILVSDDIVSDNKAETEKDINETVIESEIEQTLEQQAPIKEDVTTEEEIEAKPSNKISILGQISRKKEERIQASAAQEIKEKAASDKEKEELEDDKKDPKKSVKFANYESGFQKKSVNIIKKIQNFKYAPKTRTGFVIGIISLSVIFIASIMILFPEKHSFSIYKASILDIYNADEDEIISPEPIVPPVVEVPIVEDTQTGITDEEIEALIGDNLNSEENSELSNEQISRQRLKSYLLDKYSQSQ